MEGGEINAMASFWTAARRLLYCNVCSRCLVYGMDGITADSVN